MGTGSQGMTKFQVRVAGQDSRGSLGGMVEGSRAGVSQLLRIMWGQQGALLGRFSLCSAPGWWLKSVLGELS